MGSLDILQGLFFSGICEPCTVYDFTRKLSKYFAFTLLDIFVKNHFTSNLTSFKSEPSLNLRTVKLIKATFQKFFA